MSASQDRVVCTYPDVNGYDGPTQWVSVTRAMPSTGQVVKRRRKDKVQDDGEMSDSDPRYRVSSGRNRNGGEKKGGKARCWMFTHKGHDEGDIERFRSLKAERLVVGKEVGKGGYVHLQGYVRFTNPVGFTWWKLNFPTTHVEWRRHSESQCTRYCSKEGNVVINVGIDSDVRWQGLDRDTESEMVMDAVDNDAKYGQIRRAHRHFVFWNRRAVLDYMSDHRQLKNDPDWEPI